MANLKKVFGRDYGLVSSYLCDDADLILVTAGTIAGRVASLPIDAGQGG